MDAEFPRQNFRPHYLVVRQTSSRLHETTTLGIMTRFRPCIDLHSGQVKQIVGGTLTSTSADLRTNYVSTLPAAHFAKLYMEDGLEGAHVVMLGPGNEDAAREALAVWKGGLQVGGGITDKNAQQWIEWGAEKVGGYLPGNDAIKCFNCSC